MIGVFKLSSRSSPRPSRAPGRGGDSGFFEDPGGENSVAYSGEIYNYRELRAGLEKEGFKFRSGLDSELVLRAYARWGAACQEKFEGEWAFAVWDAEKQRLFCSRDRFGLRRFYYFSDGGVFAFGSKLKPLLRFPFVKKEVNPEAVFDYLVNNRSGSGEGTFFGGIRQLRPGHCLFLSRKTGLAKKKYYKPRYNPELGSFDKKSLRKHSAEFLALLKNSLKARLLPPYPVGCTLSGGMDSSTIVCLADGLLGGTKAGRKKLKTFSITWKAEAEYIKSVSRAAGFGARLIRPEEAGRTSWADVKKVVSAAERPLNMTTFFGGIPLLKKAGQENVKFILDGGGGDELLAGYPEKYFNVYLNQIVRAGDLPRFMKEFRTLYAGRLREFGVGKETGPGFYKTFLRTQRSAPQLSAFFPEETLAPAFLKKYAALRRRPLPRLPLNLQEMLFRDTLNLGGEYNPWGAVNYRRPFLDHRVAEYVFSLPACYKIHNGWTKYLLREAMSGILPKKVCWRKIKVGGTAPISVWKDFLKRNREKMKAALGGRKFYSAGFINQKAVLDNFDALFRAAVAPETTDISALWRFVNLELWLRENLR